MRLYSFELFAFRCDVIPSEQASASLHSSDPDCDPNIRLEMYTCIRVEIQNRAASVSRALARGLARSEGDESNPELLSFVLGRTGRCSMAMA